MGSDETNKVENHLVFQLSTEIWRVIILNFLGFKSWPPIDLLLLNKKIYSMLMSNEFLSGFSLNISQDKLLSLIKENNIDNCLTRQSCDGYTKNTQSDEYCQYKHCQNKISNIINPGFLLYLKKFTGILSLKTSLVRGNRYIITLFPLIMNFLTIILTQCPFKGIYWYDTSMPNYTRSFFCYLRLFLSNNLFLQRKIYKQSSNVYDSGNSFSIRWKHNFKKNYFQIYKNKINILLFHDDSIIENEFTQYIRILGNYSELNSISHSNLISSDYIQVDISSNPSNANSNNKLSFIINLFNFFWECFFNGIFKKSYSRRCISLRGLFFEQLQQTMYPYPLNLDYIDKKIDTCLNHIQTPLSFLPIFSCQKIKSIECYGHLIDLNNFIHTILAAKSLNTISLYIYSISNKLDKQFVHHKDWVKYESQDDICFNKFEYSNIQFDRNSLEENYLSIRNITHFNIDTLYINWMSDIYYLSKFIEIFNFPNLKFFKVECLKYHDSSELFTYTQFNQENSLQISLTLFYTQLIRIIKSSSSLEYLGIKFNELDNHLENLLKAPRGAIGLHGLSLPFLKGLTSSFEFFLFLLRNSIKMRNMRIWHCLGSHIDYTFNRDEYRSKSFEFDIINTQKRLNFLVTAYLPLSSPLSLKYVKYLKLSLDFYVKSNQIILMKFPNVYTLSIACTCTCQFVKELILACGPRLGKLNLLGYLQGDITDMITTLEEIVNIKRIILNMNAHNNEKIKSKLLERQFSCKVTGNYWKMDRLHSINDLSTIHQDNRYHSEHNSYSNSPLMDIYTENKENCIINNEFEHYTYTEQRDKLFDIFQQYPKKNNCQSNRDISYDFSNSNWYIKYWKDPFEGNYFFKSQNMH